MIEATAIAEDRHFWFRGLRVNAQLLLTEALAGKRVRWIVDCGAGTGRNLDWLVRYGRAVGVEQSAAGLSVARSRSRPVIKGTVAQLPFADESVDVATSFDVLYCLDDETERAAVQEMWRVLKPGGVAIVNAAALDMLHGSHSALTMEKRRYSRQRLVSLLERPGFVVERITFTNFTTFPITLASRWFDRITGRAATASETELQVPAAPINAFFSVVLALESTALRAVNLPIGTSLMCVARKPLDMKGMKG